MDISQKISVPIDTDDNDLKTFLSDLQGNILKGHGRDHTVNCFLRFEGSKESVGDALAALATEGHITSAATQLADTAALKKGGPRDVPAAFLFVTHSGYVKLGMTAVQNAETPFTEGMAARKNLGDNTDTWEHRLRSGIDAMLLVARDAPKDVDNSTKYAEAGAVAHADMLMARLSAAGVVEQAREIGRARKNKDKEGIEHFGYVDGRSQPLLLKSEVASEPKQHWDPSFSPLSTVLVADPNGAHADTEQSFGSYFVFRKLEQNVWGFKDAELKLAKELGLWDLDPKKDKSEIAGAMAVGRFEDGTPFVLDQVEKGVPVLNDFNYADDPRGDTCPFHSHIRKLNPRGDTVRVLNAPDETGERSHIMARRGITYGDRCDDPNDKDLRKKPEAGNGLLFMAYQNSLERQFEFTQAAWANNPAFVDNAVKVEPNTGIDPVVGQGDPSIYQWPNPVGTTQRTPAPFAQHVKMLGGEYFFAPCISAIQSFGQAALVVADAELAGAK